MKVAELFVNIGVTGGAVAGRMLGNVSKGMGEIVSASIEAKAAIVGVLVGLERLTGWASQAGMDFTKFKESTGESAQELQKWQYALGRFDVDAKETEQTIRGVQSAMTDMAMGKGAPEGIGLLKDTVGLDETRLSDTFYMMGKIQEFVKKVPPNIAQNLMNSLHITPNMLQGMKMMNLEVDKLGDADIISDDEIKRLTEMNIAWKDFWFSVKTFGMKLWASKGVSALVTDMVRGATAIVNIGKSIVGFIGDSEGLVLLIAAIGAALALWMGPITALGAVISGVIYLIGQVKNFMDNKDLFGGLIKGETVAATKAKLRSLNTPSAAPVESKFMTPFDRMMAEKKAAAAQGGSSVTTSTQNVSIDVKSTDPKEAASEIQKALTRTRNQSPSIGDGKVQ